jgi:UPF0755 protein
LGRKRARSKGTGRRRRIARALIFALAALVAFALAALGWLGIVYPKTAGPGRGREVSISIAPGEAIDSVAERLHRARAIERPSLFVVYARLLGADHHLRTGSVMITDDMTPRDVLQRIAIGFGEASVRVTIPEGFDRFDIAARLERWGICSAAEFLRASEDRALLDDLEIEAPSAEGYLFPDTYRIEQNIGGEAAVRLLVENFHARVDPIADEESDSIAAMRRELGWDRHRALILASIVEKEAAVEDERPTIARVFMNRMVAPGFSPRRLQADPTVSYGCRAHPTIASCAARPGRAITRAMLADRENPYNTYRHEGLPPGPICNPGLASIRAVLRAERHDYLYFVARGRGRHTFSATLDEHNAAVARLRARE